MGCGGSKPEEGQGQLFASTPAPAPELDGPLSREDILARHCGTKSVETFALTPSTGMTLRYAVLSQRGYYPEDLYKGNQDTYIVVPEFAGVSGDILLGVFDGHGKDGNYCSRFARDKLVPELTKNLKSLKKVGPAYTKSFVQINKEMINVQDSFDADYSGTTAVTALFRGGEMHIANVGDSRVIIGERRGAHTIAVPLSHDQTPFRHDERERVKKAGSYIRSCAHVAGEIKYTPSWEEKLESEDNSGDPPRLYRMDLMGPGCAFTRSIGDGEGERIGVFAEPELVSKKLREQDQFICLASDGVWEFLSSQRVVDMVLRFTSPLEACHAVVAESYRLWLQYDVRTDDLRLV